MTTDCREIEQWLSSYLENNLSEAERQSVRDHLDSCRECSLLLGQMQTMLHVCRFFPELEPPTRLVEKILVRTTGKHRSLSWKEYLLELFMPVYSSPRFAAGACLAVVSFAIVFNALGINLGQVKWSDLTPRGVLQSVNRGVYLAYDNGMRRLNDLRILYQIQSKIDELSSQQPEPSKDSVDTPKDANKPQQNCASEYFICQQNSILRRVLMNPQGAGSRSGSGSGRREGAVVSKGLYSHFQLKG